MIFFMKLNPVIRIFSIIFLVLCACSSMAQSPFQTSTSGKQIWKEASASQDIGPLFTVAWAHMPNTPLLNYWNDQIESYALHALNSGVDINARDAQGRTALMHAVIAPNHRLFNLLLHLGARVDIRDIYGNDLEDVRALVQPQNPHQFASQLKNLIKHSYQGIDISPLVYQAVLESDIPALEAWIQKGVSPNFQTRAYSIFEMAEHRSDYAIMDFLATKGADTKNANILELLSKGEFQLARFLISKGATFNREHPTDREGTPTVVHMGFLAAAQGYFFYSKNLQKDLAFLEATLFSSPQVASNTLNYFKYFYMDFVHTPRQQKLANSILEVLERKILLSTACISFFAGS